MYCTKLGPSFIGGCLQNYKMTAKHAKTASYQKLNLGGIFKRKERKNEND